MKKYTILFNTILKIPAESSTEAYFKLYKMINETEYGVEDFQVLDFDDEDFSWEEFEKMVKNYEKRD